MNIRMSIPDGSGYLKPDEMCEWLNVEKDWLYDAVQRKQIPHIKIGRQLRFDRAEVSEWLDVMRSKVKVDTTEFHGHQVRFIMVSGEPWYVAADIEAALAEQP